MSHCNIFSILYTPNRYAVRLIGIQIYVNQNSCFNWTSLNIKELKFNVLFEDSGLDTM